MVSIKGQSRVHVMHHSFAEGAQSLDKILAQHNFILLPRQQLAAGRRNTSLSIRGRK